MPAKAPPTPLCAFGSWRLGVHLDWWPSAKTRTPRSEISGCRACAKGLGNDGHAANGGSAAGSGEWCRVEPVARNLRPPAGRYNSTACPTLKPAVMSIFKTGGRISGRKRPFINSFCRKTNLFCPKPNLFCRKVNLFCRKPNLFCRKVNLFCRKTNLFCRKTNLFCRKTNLFCRKTNLFCLKTNLFCHGTNLFCRKANLFCLKTNLFCPIQHPISRRHGSAALPPDGRADLPASRGDTAKTWNAPCYHTAGCKGGRWFHSPCGYCLEARTGCPGFFFCGNRFPRTNQSPPGMARPGRQGIVWDHAFDKFFSLSSLKGGEGGVRRPRRFKFNAPHPNPLPVWRGEGVCRRRLDNSCQRHNPGILVDSPAHHLP